MLACGSRGKQKAVAYAYAGPASFNLRGELGLRAQTTATVEHGERLEILETKRKFVRVRTTSGAEGWTDSSYLLTQAQMDDLNRLSEHAAQLPSQGDATVFDTLNVHIGASRTSASFAQINEGDKIDVLAHRVTERQLPGGGQSADDWFLIRTPEKRSGWVLARMVLMNIPDEIAAFADRHYIMGYRQIGEAEGQPTWLWTTATHARQPYDFDAIRISVFNARRQKYETAFVDRNLRGYYPVEVQGDSFSAIVEERDGMLVKRIYNLNGARPRLASKQPYSHPEPLPEVSVPRAFDTKPPKEETWADRARGFAEWWFGI